MGFFQILFNIYFRPRRAMEAITELETPRYGALYLLIRALLISLLFYLPFYLLRFQPITLAYLQVLNTPNYFLYAVFFWPAFAVVEWIYLGGIAYVVLRLLGYTVDFDEILNLSALLSLAIGIVLFVFDWLMVAVGWHNNAIFLGIAHVLIVAPWSITLTAIYYDERFEVSPWVTVLLGILLQALYIPLAMLVVRT